MSRQAKKMQFLILQKNNNFLANGDVLLLYLLYIPIAYLELDR